MSFSCRLLHYFHRETFFSFSIFNHFFRLIFIFFFRFRRRPTQTPRDDVRALKSQFLILISSSLSSLVPLHLIPHAKSVKFSWEEKRKSRKNSHEPNDPDKFAAILDFSFFFELLSIHIYVVFSLSVHCRPRGPSPYSVYEAHEARFTNPRYRQSHS